MRTVPLFVGKVMDEFFAHKKRQYKLYCLKYLNKYLI